MPGGNRMGPMGQGPSSGRGLGRCQGRGSQAGSGRGRNGWRHCFHATGQPGWMRFGAEPVEPRASRDEDGRQGLREQVESLREQLSRLDVRLAALPEAEPGQE